MRYTHINDSRLLKELAFINLLAVISVILIFYFCLILFFVTAILLAYYFKEKNCSNTFF
jgi:preprotein translocase subunit SecG